MKEEGKKEVECKKNENCVPTKDTPRASTSNTEVGLSDG